MKNNFKKSSLIPGADALANIHFNGRDAVERGKGWSETEKQSFIEGIREHGRNWKKVAAKVTTRNLNSIKSYSRVMRLELEKNSELPGTDILSTLQKVRAVSRWTDEERDKFVEAVRLHGKNWPKVTQQISTRDISQVRSYSTVFRNLCKKNPEISGMDILPLL